MRRIVIAIAAIVLVAPVFAADNASGPAKPHFELTPSDTGFTRLDTTTGALSHCDEKGGVWYCNPLIEADGPIAGRIDALAAEVAALTEAIADLPSDVGVTVGRLDLLAAEVAALAGRVEALAAAPPVVQPRPSPEASPPAPSLVAAAVERLLAMVWTLKHGRETPSA